VSAQLPPDIYRGRNPVDLPLYSLAEASHYLRQPSATLRAWTVGRPYPTAKGQRHFPPVVAVADRSGLLLSFRNLVELHVLRAYPDYPRITITPALFW
jgi:hypothetical protein